MANTRSAAKRARQTVRRTTANRRVRSEVKSDLKSVREAIINGDKTKAEEALREFSSTIDKAVKTGRAHRNSANRHKSNFSKQIAAL